jgi:hypothetical protein
MYRILVKRRSSKKRPQASLGSACREKLIAPEHSAPSTSWSRTPAEDTLRCHRSERRAEYNTLSTQTAHCFLNRRSASMTSSQLLLYLAFALACGFGLLAWLQILVILHRRRFGACEAFLSEEERLEWEQATSDTLLNYCRQDEAAGARFVSACLRNIPQLNRELSLHLHQQPEIGLRLIDNAVRHLPDDRLAQLAAQLGCLPTRNSAVAAWSGHQRRRHTLSISPQLTAGAALATMLLILLVPPWVAEQQRQTRILGVSRSMTTIERKTTGYHWLLAGTIPDRKITPRATASLGHLEFDEYGWRIDYPRLCLQLAALSCITSGMIWLKRPGHAHDPS